MDYVAVDDGIVAIAMRPHSAAAPSLERTAIGTPERAQQQGILPPGLAGQVARQRRERTGGIIDVWRDAETRIEFPQSVRAAAAQYEVQSSRYRGVRQKRSGREQNAHGREQRMALRPHVVG